MSRLNWPCPESYCTPQPEELRDAKVTVGCSEDYQAKDEDGALELVLHRKEVNPQVHVDNHHARQGEGEHVVDSLSRAKKKEKEDVCSRVDCYSVILM